MDEYFKSIVGNFIWGLEAYVQYPDELHIREYLSHVSEYHTIWHQWFYNCRYFHKFPCEECEYRFRCYTT